MDDDLHSASKWGLDLLVNAAAALMFCCLAAGGGAAFAQSAVVPSRGAHPDQPVLDKAQLERRFASVGFLLEKSSAARQIEASGDAGALERRARARESYRQAQETFKAEDLAGTARLLAEASALMMEAARLANPAQVNGEKQRTDFAARLASVKALLAADRRVIAEKHAAPKAAETSRTVEKMIAEATQLAATDKLPEGRALLDRAYLVARAALSSMRGGDTLTRSAHFANKEEEFQYEIERNNTHRTLIHSLLADKRNAQAAEATAQASVETAARLRGEAERRSAAGDFAAAVEQLDQSTRELLRAIRSLGIFVPG